MQNQWPFMVNSLEVHEASKKSYIYTSRAKHPSRIVFISQTMWFKQFNAIVNNTVRVVISDPFFLVLHLTGLLSLVVLGAIPGFTFGEHIKLLRDQSQALAFIIGCLVITFGFIRVLTDDLRRGAGVVLMSRPLDPFCLIFGKWMGVIISLGVMQVSLLASYLWVTEMAYNPEYLNTASIILYLLTVVFAVSLSALRHYVFGGSYSGFANIILFCSVFFFFLIRMLARGPDFFDWYGCQSSVILFFGLVAFSAVLLPIAIIFDSALVLSLGVATFFFGMISEYFVNMIFSPGFLSTIFRSIIPNWQYYWVADRLGSGQTIPAGYFATCGIQAFSLAMVYMIVAVFIFERMEVDSKL